ncbi:MULTISPECIES: hypothetical protein [Clostridium]|nr:MULTISPECIES: hypothetical protein [Clostridium]MBE6043575.1 hypothetical protein [Clostridium thermopalmarium]
MSKKEEIIRLFKEGFSAEEIRDRTQFNLKYIKEVIRKYSKNVDKKAKEKSLSKNNEFTAIYENIKDMQFEIDKLKIMFDEIVDKDREKSKNEERILLNIEEVENFIKNIKKNIANIRSFKVKFIIDWDSSETKKNEEIIEEGPFFNPIAFYMKEGEKRLREKLNYFSNQELKSIIKAYAPDPKGYAYRWKSKERLLKYILEKVKAFTDSGKVFYT